VATGGSEGVHDATVEHGAITRDHRAGEDVLQGLPEGSGVWELVHQSAVSLNPGLTDNVRRHDGDNFFPERWPENITYSRGISAFSRKLQRLLGDANIDLSSVNAAYALAFRSKSISEWKKSVPADVRIAAEQLSLDALSRIIEILNPPFIYSAGFKTYRLMGCVSERIEVGQHLSGEDFDLLHYGNFNNVPVVASIHPSGAHPSNDNLVQISQGIQKLSLAS
jgi:hypothetical protein